MFNLYYVNFSYFFFILFLTLDLGEMTEGQGWTIPGKWPPSSTATFTENVYISPYFSVSSKSRVKSVHLAIRGLRIDRTSIFFNNFSSFSDYEQIFRRLDATVLI